MILNLRVASFTDAWIETSAARRYCPLCGSHPLRMRGLKLIAGSQHKLSIEVASFTDAWIETKAVVDKVYKAASHPLRMRGLKLEDDLIPFAKSSRILYGCVD